MYNRHLETFIVVADLGSFSKVADVLYISSTAVIKQINLLEQELGLQLFDRTHRGISLTKAGRSIYGDAKYMIQYAKDSITRAHNAMQGEEKNHTYRQFPDDAVAVYSGAVAENQTAVSGYEISNSSVRKYPGKRP